ncbi:thiol:disulfide interchange protein DsbA/DsbL [Niveibacterium sp. 24ML]|uniref:thiol:disulfide interchange protein DsbA/DsbL n=1 Tax=Niveibacterium sp. 24ML TaxID=2985512 RepID=UPI002271D785|nr:thiol:disulfide interchange protein DsbA/DsbL [Niveibacterium sp. 24ML]MCX9157382.1 thiol:disulfide interchange protein DsbA/DsbL [Niveibacterium sp. 24ML]
MNRRHLFKAASAAVITILAGPVFAQRALQAGKDYRQISPAQPTESGDKIEVLEFFSYGCPHCRDLDPILADWEKRLPKDVALRRIPVTFNRDAWTVLAKLYLSFEVMGEAARMAAPTFVAVHDERLNLGDEAVRNAWLQKQGVNVAKFNETFRSFAVASKLQRATQLAGAYQIQGVPSLIVDGKYTTAPSMVNSLEGTVTAADQLIAMARKERGRK